VNNQANIESEIEQLKEEMAELKEKTVEIEETISSLHEEIMDAGGNDLRVQKICVNDIRKQIDNMNNRITKNMVAKTKAEKDLSKLEASIVKFEKESEKFEQNLKELDDELKQHTKDMADIVAKVNEAKEVYIIHHIALPFSFSNECMIISLWKKKRLKWKRSRKSWMKDLKL
jgi:structural maintenance of chromosome 4